MILSDYEKSTLWDKRDYEIISRYIRAVKLANNRAMKIHLVKSFEKLLDRTWNDQGRGNNSLLNQKCEPLEIQQARNKVVIGGLDLLTQLMAGSAFDVPLFLASGTGTEEVDENQDTLSNENARVSVIDEGWRLSDGNSVKMTGRFDPNTASALISEFGSFDAITGGAMEWRVVLDSPLNHTQGATFYMSYHSLNLNPTS